MKTIATGDIAAEYKAKIEELEAKCDAWKCDSIDMEGKLTACSEKCEKYEKALRRIAVPNGLDTGWEYEVAKEALGGEDGQEETKDKKTETV